MAFLGLFAGGGLAVASMVFYVKIDPRLEKLEKELPGANCGACGYAGCKVYAEAVMSGADPGLCKLGGEKVTRKITELLGLTGVAVTKEKAVILCGAGVLSCEQRSEYLGENTCRANTITSGGSSACGKGCLAFGDCIPVCPVDAIKHNGKLPPVIDREKCIGCGKCVAACPRNIIILANNDRKTFVLCSSNDKGPFTRKICKTGCFACRICVKDSPNGSMTMEGRIPSVHHEKGEPPLEWIKKCPAKTIVQYQ